MKVELSEIFSGKQFLMQLLMVLIPC